ncbi:hypothetical protein SISSUDRAFT_193262 [Sistotremastrum suecicum HHB10207 ss-3]|uniref:Uncharacterized protein n=1 Tax=Sistotremastrum suecicum HHB10207 ss-3 TaxID=1314776 RepID=A0A166ACU6_9AGAM|nr:hypothetical protein SISSUDRAFT_193262 [Sistotremastrum suecicum HHB10207 ss-3]
MRMRHKNIGAHIIPWTSRPLLRRLVQQSHVLKTVNPTSFQLQRKGSSRRQGCGCHPCQPNARPNVYEIYRDLSCGGECPQPSSEGSPTWLQHVERLQPRCRSRSGNKDGINSFMTFLLCSPSFSIPPANWQQLSNLRTETPNEFDQHEGAHEGMELGAISWTQANLCVYPIGRSPGPEPKCDLEISRSLIRNPKTRCRGRWAPL